MILIILCGCVITLYFSPASLLTYLKESFSSSIFYYLLLSISFSLSSLLHFKVYVHACFIDHISVVNVSIMSCLLSSYSFQMVLLLLPKNRKRERERVKWFVVLEWNKSKSRNQRFIIFPLSSFSSENRYIPSPNRMYFKSIYPLSFSPFIVWI